jgi:hypothetical protein
LRAQRTLTLLPYFFQIQNKVVVPAVGEIFSTKVLYENKVFESIFSILLFLFRNIINYQYIKLQNNPIQNYWYGVALFFLKDN